MAAAIVHPRGWSRSYEITNNMILGWGMAGIDIHYMCICIRVKTSIQLYRIEHVIQDLGS